MPHFKGEVLPLSAIKFGSPVEIQDASAFRFPISVPTDQPILGILMAILPDYTKWNVTNAVRAKFAYWTGTAFNVYELSAKGGGGVPKEMKVMKVLTGDKGRFLQAKYASYCVTTNWANTRYILGADVGCDPEIFAVRSSGDVLPAWEFLPSKAQGLRKMDPGSAGGYISAYWDGFQAEFTNDQARCASWVVDRLQLGLGTILTEARKMDPGARLSLQSVLPIFPQVMESASEEHVALGCLPSLNAYGNAGEILANPRDFPFRVAGGHVHLGTSAQLQDPKTHPEIVKMLDAIVGVATVGMFANMDNPLRRRFYGLAGEYRSPAHGLEYRVLSNAWLCHPAIAFWVFDMCRGAATLGVQGLREAFLGRGTEKEVQAIINNCDVKKARKWFDTHRALYNRLLGDFYFGGLNTERATATMIEQGVESVIDPQAIEENWLLNTERAPTDGKKHAKNWTSHAESPGKTFASMCSRWNGEATWPPPAKAATA